MPATLNKADIIKAIDELPDEEIALEDIIERLVVARSAGRLDARRPGRSSRRGRTAVRQAAQRAPVVVVSLTIRKRRPQALHDLEAIETYYEEVAPEYATHFVKTVLLKTRQLEQLLRVGRTVPESADPSRRKLIHSDGEFGESYLGP